MYSVTSDIPQTDQCILSSPYVVLISPMLHVDEIVHPPYDPNESMRC